MMAATNSRNRCRSSDFTPADLCSFPSSLSTEHGLALAYFGGATRTTGKLDAMASSENCTAMCCVSSA
jgi:hypothetical protein